MIIKSFVASDLVKARWLLNEELGPDSVVLRTRFNNTRRKSAKPLKFVEITAALDSSLFAARNNDNSHLNPNEVPNSTHPAGDGEIPNVYDICGHAEFVEVIGW